MMVMMMVVEVLVVSEYEHCKRYISGLGLK